MQEALDLLEQWQPLNAAEALELLSADFTEDKTHPAIQKYAVSRLQRVDSEVLYICVCICIPCRLVHCSLFCCIHMITWRLLSGITDHDLTSSNYHTYNIAAYTYVRILRGYVWWESAKRAYICLHSLVVRAANCYAVYTVSCCKSNLCGVSTFTTLWYPNLLLKQIFP